MDPSQPSQPPNAASQLYFQARPQYHYFYGSTPQPGDASTVLTNDTNEQDSLVGEILVPTDNEDEPSLASGGLHIQHVLVSNGSTGTGWFSSGRAQLQGEQEKPSNSFMSALGVAFIVLLLAAPVVVFLVLLLPNTIQPKSNLPITHVPFQHVERADYGDPVDTFINLDLFHPSLLSPVQPQTFQFPFPTGAFWTNLVVPSPDAIFSYPIVVYPYAYKWSQHSLAMSYPAAHRTETESHTSISDTFLPDLTITALEKISQRYVVKFDPMSVTIRYISDDNTKWESTLVQGSPYTTMAYENVTPMFKALSTFSTVQCPGDEAEDFHDFVEDIDQPVDSGGAGRKLFGVCDIDKGNTTVSMRGVQFMFSTQEGAHWIVFTSEPIAFDFDLISKTTIQSKKPFTGVLRVAYIPAQDHSDTSVFASTGLRRLIYHAGVYPTGTQVSWEVHTPTDAAEKVNKLVSARKVKSHATVQFAFSTKTMTDTSLRPTAANIGLLMLALPHHVQVLPSHSVLSPDGFNLTYNCIKGPLSAVVGSTWTFDEELPDLDMSLEHQLKIDPGVREAIIDQIAQDIDIVLPAKMENVYGYGKQVARLAQIVHIADILDSDPAVGGNRSSLVLHGIDQLRSYLQNFLTGNVIDFLLFDSNLGGIVSKNGLADSAGDFGNGRYNDHHFHYGYFLYASAILADLDPKFVTDFGDYVDVLFHDIAHSGNSDSRPATLVSSFFPQSRHMSWFDGHSFATGLFPFSNGKSQESSSEAVNCYYGAYLWSLQRSSVATSQADFTNLLLAMELRGAKTYWHMLPPSALADKKTASPVYSASFQENYMVGNLGMLDVNVNTWFGNNPLYVHMINAIPITAATSKLFNRSYVQQEYKYLMSEVSSVEMAWRGYTTSIHAIIDPNQAWKDAQGLVSAELDSALSKSQVLYWISTQPGFNITIPVDSGSTPSTNSSKGGAPSAATACSSHSQCTAGGLMGECCPTPDNVFLDCCNSN
eukprot:Nitzschia sp. Nitz4//scaffold64_size103689//29119//32314//NITZ4_004428-RA/size103689-snap-gene-0.127-mRNA-1//-1//CDS//3329556106//469//frame0